MNIIPYINEIYNFIEHLNSGNFYSKSVMKHIGSFVHGFLAKGFKGKLTEVHNNSFNKNHRTTLSHFLNNSPWEEKYLSKRLKDCIYENIQSVSHEQNTPVFMIIDDTVNKKCKPSSRVKHPIENTQFHHSHLDSKTVWGHQIVQSMIKTGDASYPLDFEIYNKNNDKSKIDIAIEMINKLPYLSAKTYFLCDSWYPSKAIVEAAFIKGIHTISALKTNRIIYPKGIKQQAKEFAKYIRIEETDLVTINNNSYRVYRYEGCLSDIDNAVVLLSWKADDKFIPSNMKCFLSTDIDLSNFDILSYYQNRWSIEVYFKNIKQYLGFGGYQMRKSKAINRYLLLLQLTYCYLISQITKCFGNAISDIYSKKHHNIIEFIHIQTLFGTSTSFDN